MLLFQTVEDGESGAKAARDGNKNGKGPRSYEPAVRTPFLLTSGT
jgi:hypothetical protein